MDFEAASDHPPQVDVASTSFDREMEIEPRPLQFSLQGMFLLMTVLAVAFSLLLAAPPVVRFIGAAFFLLALPTVLTVVLIYGRGYARTFCIGALFPAGTMLWPFGSGVPMIMYGMGGDLGGAGWIPALYVAAAYVVSMIFGAIAVVVRRLVESRLQQQDTGRSTISP